MSELSLVAYGCTKAKVLDKCYGYGLHGWLCQGEVEGAGFKTADANIYHTSTGYTHKKNTDGQTRNSLQIIEKYNLSFDNPEVAGTDMAEVAIFVDAARKCLEKQAKSFNYFAESGMLQKQISSILKNYQKLSSKDWIRPDGQPVKQSGLWKELYAVTNELEAAKVKVKIAVINLEDPAMAFGQREAKKLAVVGYHGKVHESVDEIEERHPLLAYANTLHHTDNDTPGVIYTFGQYDMTTIGMPSSVVTHAVVLLAKPPKALEALKSAVLNNAGIKGAQLWSANLISLYKPTTIADIEAYGSHAFTPSTSYFRHLSTLGDLPAAHEIDPPGMALMAHDSFYLISRILGSFIEVVGNKPSGLDSAIFGGFAGVRYVATDVTKYFYDTVEVKPTKANPNTSKLVLKPEIKGAKQDIHVNVWKLPDSVEKAADGETSAVNCTLSFDTLPRNNLKRLETMNPKIYVVLYKVDDTATKMASIIVANNGGSLDYLITEAPYSGWIF